MNCQRDESINWGIIDWADGIFFFFLQVLFHFHTFFFFWPWCEACGILVPQGTKVGSLVQTRFKPGIEPMPPAMEVQFSSVQSLSHVRLFGTPRTV